MAAAATETRALMTEAADGDEPGDAPHPEACRAHRAWGRLRLAAGTLALLAAAAAAASLASAALRPGQRRTRAWPARGGGVERDARDIQAKLLVQDGSPSLQCPWMTTTGVHGLLECQDGHRCFGWGCCQHRGGRAKCPPNLPAMCSDTSCAGDHCCKKDCKSFGGVRPCPVVPKQPQYVLHSTRRSCRTDKHFLWEGPDVMCQSRCSSVPGCVYFTVYPSGWCQLSNACSLDAKADAAAATYARTDVMRVLFIGNSFTYVNDLPHQLVNVASSLGRLVEVARSTIGGCTLWAQRAAANKRTAALLEKSWDYIVLQDYSMLPTVKAAREKYLFPGIGDFVSRRGSAKIALYLTWGYQDGSEEQCPTSQNAGCFAKGTLASLTAPPCAGPNGTYAHSMGSFGCMSYALTRGYLSALSVEGVDLVVPAGLAWQVARGLGKIPAACRAAIEAEYDQPLGFELPPPLGEGSVPGLGLYLRAHGKADKHPNKAGQYLNALTFYASLFEASPLGAAQPACTDNCYGDNWVREPGPLNSPLAADQLLALQRAAAGAVAHCGRACRRRAGTIRTFFRK